MYLRAFGVCTKSHLLWLTCEQYSTPHSAHTGASFCQISSSQSLALTCVGHASKTVLPSWRRSIGQMMRSPKYECVVCMCVMCCVYMHDACTCVLRVHVCILLLLHVCACCMYNEFVACICFVCLYVHVCVIIYWVNKIRILVITYISYL